jgi:hypothetical protein
MDSSDASNVYITGWTKPHIYFLGWAKNPQESAKLGGGRQCNHRTEYPRFSIFRSTTCLHFHDCAHGDGLRRRQECHGFRRFLDSARRCMDSSDASNVYITDWTKLQHILSWLGENPAGISAQLAYISNDRTIFHIRRSISLNDVSFHFHHCAHRQSTPIKH